MDGVRQSLMVLVGACLLVGGDVHAQTPVSRVRGDIVSVNGNAIELKADSGQTLAVKLADRYGGRSLASGSLEDRRRCFSRHHRGARAGWNAHRG